MGWNGPALFVGDAPGLDFLNSIATPAGTTIDWIGDGEGLLRWLAQAEFVPAEVLQAIRAQARPGELDKIAQQARHLREWFRGFVRKHKGRPLSSRAIGELEPLSRLLERDEMFSGIVRQPGTKPLALQLTRRWRSPGSLLFPIGEAMARLVCTEDFSRVKACEGPACTLLFADHTRGRTRRWCVMAICGNRAKQASHRKRLRAPRRPR